MMLCTSSSERVSITVPSLYVNVDHARSGDYLAHQLASSPTTHYSGLNSLQNEFAYQQGRDDEFLSDQQVNSSLNYGTPHPTTSKSFWEPPTSQPQPQLPPPPPPPPLPQQQQVKVSGTAKGSTETTNKQPAICR